MKKKKEKKMDQEVAVKESGALASPMDVAAWGKQELTSQDIIIPRLLVMQGMSEMVTDGKAKFGDVVENLNGEVLAGLESGIEILPFKLEKIYKYIGADGKVLSSEPITPENENAGFECEVDGMAAKRFRTFQFYVLLPSELEVGGALPYMVEFKSTGLRAGKKMVTQMFAKNSAIGLTPAGKTFMLTVDKVSNDKGTYAVPDVSVCRDSQESEVSEAHVWFKRLQGGARVHENEA